MQNAKKKQTFWEFFFGVFAFEFVFVCFLTQKKNRLYFEILCWTSAIVALWLLTLSKNKICVKKKQKKKTKQKTKGMWVNCFEEMHLCKVMQVQWQVNYDSQQYQRVNVHLILVAFYLLVYLAEINENEIFDPSFLHFQCALQIWHFHLWFFFVLCLCVVCVCVCCVCVSTFVVLHYVC